MSDLELGLDTFGDVTAGPDGQPLSHAQVIRNVIEEGVLAEGVGVDFFGIGEHHRADFAVSSPELPLAAIAARTHRIRVGSAVTVLSSIRCACSSASPACMPRRTGGPRSS